MNTKKQYIPLGKGVQSIQINKNLDLNHYFRFRKIMLFILFLSFKLALFAQTNWLGISSNNWFSEENWSNGLPTINSTANISAGVPNMPMILAEGAECKNLVLHSGASLSMNESGELTLSGNWMNEGTFNPNNGIVNFEGTTTQGVFGITTFDLLFINNSSGVFIGNNITVRTILKFDNGNLMTGDNTVTVDTNGISVPINGFVDGNLRLFTPEGFGISGWYTVGNNSGFTPIELFFDNVYNAGYITVKTVKGDHPYIGTSGFNDTLTVNRYWSIGNEGVIFDQCNVGIQYLNSDRDPSLVDTVTSLRIYSNGNWSSLQNGDNLINYHSTANLTSFGDLQIGELNEITQSAIINPVYGAQGQTLDIVVFGEGFISVVPDFNFGNDITINSITIESDTRITLNISIALVAELGTRIVVIGGYNEEMINSADNFTITPALPVSNFEASQANIDCYLDGSITFNNLSIEATNYIWNFGVGANPCISNEPGPILVSYATSGSKTVSLISVNSSGRDTLTKFAFINVNAQAPLAPSTITGPIDVCSLLGANVNYSCSEVTSAIEYNWTVPIGTNLVSGQGTSNIVVHYPIVGYNSGTLSVNTSNGCGVSSSTQQVPIAVLPAPGFITGPNAVCGLSTAVYSIMPVNGAISYLWTVPSGLTIISGQGTTAIRTSILSGTINGNITVKATNSTCIISPASTLLITKKPQTPDTIQGPVSLCGQSTATYSIPLVSGATSYTWLIPSGMSITGGNNTRTITVSITPTFVAGFIKVTAVNSCGSVAGTSLSVQGKIPGLTSSISGPINVCGLSTITYSAAGILGATSYSWFLPSGFSVLSGGTTNSITVLNNGFTNGSIGVSGINGCGTGPRKALAINIVSSIPGLITGPTLTCGLTSATYYISPVAGALVDAYHWVVPTGTTLNSGQGTTNISISFVNPVTGTISVTSNNGCANSVARTLAISKVPKTPGAITGPKVLCGLTTTNFSIAPVSGASNYFWMVPSGMSISNGQGNISITVSVPPAFTSGQIRVYAQSLCGSSSPAILAFGACAEPIQDTTFELKSSSISVISPNPASEVIEITINTVSLSKEIQVEIYDLLGNIVLSSKQSIIQGQKTVETEVKQLKNGVYIVKVIQGDYSPILTQKFVKQ